MAIGKTAFDERIETVSETLVSGDAERLADLYTRDAELLPPDEAFVTGTSAIVDYWQAFVESGVADVELETRGIDRGEEMTVRTGEARLADAAGESLGHVKFVEVWKPEDGVWRIHRDVWNGMGEA